MKKIILLAVVALIAISGAQAQITTALVPMDTLAWDSIPIATKIELLKSANAGQFNAQASVKILNIVSVTYVVGIPKTRSTDPADKNQIWIVYTNLNNEKVNLLASTKKNECTIMNKEDVTLGYCYGDCDYLHNLHNK